MTAPTSLEKTLEAVFPGDQASVLADQISTLQASIAANVSAIAATIVNGDTTHAPSGDAVFDALALKRDSAFTPTTAGDWPVQPTTIQEALDKLADRLNVLEP